MKNDIFTVIDSIDIYLTNINGKKIEISRLLMSLEFYENLFNTFLTGKLVIIDTLDLLKNFIIIGNETLNIDLHTTDIDKSITLDFKIYKINPEKTNHRGDVKRKLIELYFCSNDAIINQKISISKKFSGKSENTIQTLLTTYLSSEKTLSSDATSSDVTVYSNFWKPTKIIDFLCKISKNSDYSDYIFYETFNGFNFKTVSNLISQNAIHNIKFKTDTDSFIGNTNIKIHKFENYFDIINLLNSGLFGTTFYKPHDTNYSYQKNTKTLSENYDTIYTNGSSKHFNDNLSDDSNSVSVNLYDPEISEVRLASLKLLQNYNLTIQLNGDFGRTIGQNLNIEFPNLDNETTLNEFFNGNWFIVGIRHIISQRNTFTQNILLCKNAFFNHKDLESITTLVNV